MQRRSNNITTEVMSEDGVYANHGGNEASRLRPDSTGGATAEGPCLNTDRCTGGDALPAGLEDGGPTSIMARHWVVDPNSTPPIGDYSCGVCDAIVSNTHEMPTPTEGQAYTTFATGFFWQAPDNAPAAEGGRIRFYMAGVDGDGYADTLGDDFADVRVAVCPAGVGVGECDPMVGAGWGLGLAGSPPPPTATVSAAAPAPSRAPRAPAWVPVGLCALFIVTSAVWIGRSAHWSTAGA